MTDELSGTSWMDADHRPPVATVNGFAIVDRVGRADRPHPMIARSGEMVEPRLRQCSLYDPTLDVAVEDLDGQVAGYALFWFDPTTRFVETSLDRLLIRPARHDPSRRDTGPAPRRAASPRPGRP